jgi:hypothetical protein
MGTTARSSPVHTRTLIHGLPSARKRRETEMSGDSTRAGSNFSMESLILAQSER